MHLKISHFHYLFYKMGLKFIPPNNKNMLRTLDMHFSNFIDISHTNHAFLTNVFVKKPCQVY